MFRQPVRLPELLQLNSGSVMFAKNLLPRHLRLTDNYRDMFRIMYVSIKMEGARRRVADRDADFRVKAVAVIQVISAQDFMFAEGGNAYVSSLSFP